MKGLSEQEQENIFPADTILAGYVGSVAHGMFSPSKDSIDDKDVMGIYIAPLSQYFGFRKAERHQQNTYKEGEWDCVFYEITKMFDLWLQGNPNVASLLWLQPQHYIRTSDAGKQLIMNRKLFVSKEQYKAFTGYAYGQLHRMTHFHRNAVLSYDAVERCLYVWGIEPEHPKPNRHYRWPLEKYTEDDDISPYVSDEIRDIPTLQALHTYYLSRYSSGYMGKKRRELVKQFGYDCKNAAHLIRVLRMLIEFLSSGEMNVLRHDAQNLLEIKRGEWTLDQVKAEANRLFALADEAYVRSNLPDKPDREGAEKLMMDILTQHFRERL